MSEIVLRYVRRALAATARGLAARERDVLTQVAGYDFSCPVESQQAGEVIIGHVIALGAATLHTSQHRHQHSQYGSGEQ